MKLGMLAKYFKGVAVKRLSPVETDPRRSNQHEFNGRDVFKELLGTERRGFDARFVYLGDEQEGFAEDSQVKWYNSRENVPTRAPEYRLYYRTNAVIKAARGGDALFVALRTNDSILFVVTPAGSTIENQLLWLFGLPDQQKLNFASHEITKSDDDKLDFAVRYIFDELGIEPEEPESDVLDRVLEKFGKKFPKMSVFSETARKSLSHVSPYDDADEVLMAWLEREELLFRRLERHVLADRLKAGFTAKGEADVDSFIAVSLSVQNRRKMRAGSALESHLEYLFKQRKIRMGRGCVTEMRNKPDFLFPGCSYYSDPAFPNDDLTMLAVKSTAKDRWRQILPEAQRIKEKHLLTLSPGISTNQTDQMKAAGLRLVIPAALHETFQPAQQAWLMSLDQFLDLVTERQNRAFA